MTEITAGMVKDLREKTGAGMMDCKKALTESGGDIEAAVDWLRKKGLAAAAKKAGRVAAEGLIGVAVDGRRGALVEVNAETDFVARNADFQAFVTTVARLALQADSDVERLQGLPYLGSERTVAEELTHLIAKIGENMALRRTAVVAVGAGVIGVYLHEKQGEGLGRIGCLVGVETEASGPAIEGLAKKLAMHVAAAAPQAVSRADVDQKALERERAVLSEQARATGKPEAIIAKMVEGRLSKYYEDVCLLEQTWVIDGESKVKAVVEAVAKESGKPVTVTGFVRFARGEGIEKRQDDFAAEVASTAGR
ncbi:MAG: translation elongation factor Ts [Rhodospirillales bacterium]